MTVYSRLQSSPSLTSAIVPSRMHLSIFSQLPDGKFTSSKSQKCGQLSVEAECSPLLCPEEPKLAFPTGALKIIEVRTARLPSPVRIKDLPSGFDILWFQY